MKQIQSNYGNRLVKLILSFILLSIYFYSCTPNDKFVGTWIGKYNDKIIITKKDSTYTIICEKSAGLTKTLSAIKNDSALVADKVTLCYKKNKATECLKLSGFIGFEVIENGQISHTEYTVYNLTEFEKQ